MDFIIIFLVVLKSHPTFSILLIVGIIGILTFIPLILPKKLKMLIISFGSILFLIFLVNLFAGHFLTNMLIDNFGDKGEGMVVDIAQTSDIYNDQPVLRYNVMLKSDGNDAISTYCLTSDFNIAHTDSYNEYYFPSSGVTFNVRFLKDYPKAFVIIANDDSDYSKGLQLSKDASEISSVENQLKMDPENPTLKKKLDDLLNKQTDTAKADTKQTDINSIGYVALRFGEEGTEPGKIDDARYIAMDSGGNIWTADYSDGRIQQFSKSGEFIKMIQMNIYNGDTCYIQGLATDMNENIYVSVNGNITKFNTADGSILATFKGNYYSGALAVDKENNLFVLDSSATENTLLKLNSEGNELARFDNIVTKINKNDVAMDLDLALDSNSNIYITSHHSYKIYVYNCNGEFIKSFGEKGDNPGQFKNTPDSLAIDEQKYLYIHNFDGIYQFDINGNFIGILPIDYSDGSTRNVFVDPDGFLYTVTTNGNILKYKMNNKA